MTAQASKLAAVAHSTGRPIEFHFSAAVVIEKSGHVMAGGPEVDAGVVALLATEGRLDLVVTDEAVGHDGECRLRYGIRPFEAAMASRAGVLCVEVCKDVAGIREVGFGLDCGSDHRRNIAQSKMKLMVELSHA
jgi:hypothetical protein